MAADSKITAVLACDAQAQLDEGPVWDGDDVSIPNGLAWSADGVAMYYIDTSTQRVFAFDYDLASGAVANRREVAEIPEDEGSPDGMTIDAEGMLWIAHWGGWQAAGRCPAGIRRPGKH
ncbi:SMP-30/gluconolactonase/LRE family protein [Cohnella sp. 56]|uniref:SMP-30/gluconolactonase/LRE family protein n=1 Tax=Cohnella sp. 56 TaxID=3113722 RepID=UPI0030EA028F